MKRLSHYACQWLLLVCGLTASISASATGRDEVVFYFNDALGSAVAAVSESGNLCWSEVYSGYGEKTIDSDHGLNGEGCGVLGEERGYTGHTQDWETDLVYMQQRYYDASIGRFLSIDPLDADPNNPMTFNRYAYGNNNPYKYIDPDGRLGTFLHGLQKDLSMQEAVQIGGMGNAAVAAGVGAVGLVASAVAPGPEDLATGAVAAAAGAARIGKMFDVPNSVFHYTDEAGAKAIEKTGVIKPDAKGRVYVTQDQVSASEANNALFMGRGGSKGTHRVEIELKPDVKLDPGTQPNELIHNGAIRDPRNGNFTVKENDF